MSHLQVVDRDAFTSTASALRGRRRNPAGECRAGAIGYPSAAPEALVAAGREPSAAAA